MWLLTRGFISFLAEVGVVSSLVCGPIEYPYDRALEFSQKEQSGRELEEAILFFMI